MESSLESIDDKLTRILGALQTLIALLQRETDFIPDDMHC